MKLFLVGVGVAEYQLLTVLICIFRIIILWIISLVVVDELFSMDYSSMMEVWIILYIYNNTIYRNAATHAGWSGNYYSCGGISM